MVSGDVSRASSGCATVSGQFPVKHLGCRPCSSPPCTTSTATSPRSKLCWTSSSRSSPISWSSAATSPSDRSRARRWRRFSAGRSRAVSCAGTRDRDPDEFATATLTQEQRDFLAGLPLTVSLDVDGLGAVLFCHASPRDDEEIFTRLSPAERLDAHARRRLRGGRRLRAHARAVRPPRRRHSGS